jgi:hypothetical protein
LKNELREWNFLAGRKILYVVFIKIVEENNRRLLFWLALLPMVLYAIRLV